MMKKLLTYLALKKSEFTLGFFHIKNVVYEKAVEFVTDKSPLIVYLACLCSAGLFFFNKTEAAERFGGVTVAFTFLLGIISINQEYSYGKKFFERRFNRSNRNTSHIDRTLKELVKAKESPIYGGNNAQEITPEEKQKLFVTLFITHYASIVVKYSIIGTLCWCLGNADWAFADSSLRNKTVGIVIFLIVGRDIIGRRL